MRPGTTILEFKRKIPQAENQQLSIANSLEKEKRKSSLPFESDTQQDIVTWQGHGNRVLSDKARDPKVSDKPDFGSVQHQRDRQKNMKQGNPYIPEQRETTAHVLLAFSSSFCPELQLREGCYFHLPGVFPPQSNSTQANSSSTCPEACGLSDSRSFQCDSQQ